jgi:hypothetical protein
MVSLVRYDNRYLVTTSATKVGPRVGKLPYDSEPHYTDTRSSQIRDQTEEAAKSRHLVDWSHRLAEQRNPVRQYRTLSRFGNASFPEEAGTTP